MSPVNGVKPILEKTSSRGRQEPADLPDSKQFTKNCVDEPTLEGAEEQRVTRAFEGVLNG